ncbi:unnamed protein product [Musa acuminata var. zebrina]
MIRVVIVMNTEGKPRPLKFYDFRSNPPEKQQELIRSVFTGRMPVIPIIWKRTLNSPLLLRSFYIFATKFPLIFLRHYAVVLSGRPDNVSNFVEVDAIFGSGTRLVNKHLATLYFVFVFDGCENELPMLDLSQVPVETLDRCFKNVRELDIVFNFNKMHTVLDEIIFGGQAREIFQLNQLGAKVCNQKVWPLVCCKFQDVVPGPVHHCVGFFNLLHLS